MQVISDLHIHSRFSRATSHDLSIQNLEKWARVKGVHLLGTGDFCHPEWFKELKHEIRENGSGILKTASGFQFILSNEISLMYTQDNKGRRIHLVLLAPSFDVVQQVSNYLSKHGRLDYDGRPIFNISCDEFAEEMMAISNEIEIIPAHCMTPWFGIFGSVTGFNSIKEAFKDKEKEIHAVETGMSADPAMLWRMNFLDNKSLISFSDSHSFWPWRIGREATAFDLKELSYKNIIDTISNKKIAFTIETSPSYGKYHYDGHRLCNFSCSPEESIKLKNICPICKKQLTIGVLNRVNQLADRLEGFRPQGTIPFKTLLPLHELISAVFGMAMTTKKVWQEYNLLISKFQDEFNILLNVPENELRKTTNEKIVSAILKNREGKIKVKPGFDGEYGQAILEGEKQEKLF